MPVIDIPNVESVRALLKEVNDDPSLNKFYLQFSQDVGGLTRLEHSQVARAWIQAASYFPDLFTRLVNIETVKAYMSKMFDPHSVQFRHQVVTVFSTVFADYASSSIMGQAEKPVEETSSEKSEGLGTEAEAEVEVEVETVVGADVKVEAEVEANNTSDLPNAETDFESMTKDELLALADELGLSVKRSLSKAKIVEALRSA